ATTAVGAGTNSGSTHPRRATASQAVSRTSTLSTCSTRIFMTGGPDMAPRPPTLGAPRRSRGAPRYQPWPSRRPTVGATFDHAGQRVGADDQDEGDQDERHVVAGAEEAVGVVDERAHAAARAEDLAHDDADDGQGQARAQPTDQREQHRRNHHLE